MTGPPYLGAELEFRRPGHRGGTEKLRRRVATSISNGLTAVVTRQHGDGSWMLNKVVHGEQPQPAHGLFSTTAVLLAVGDLIPDETRERAIDYLLSVRGETGHWRFDPAMDIPFDVDDTACALASIARYRPSAVSAADADILLGYWREPRGPFRTWDPDADATASYWGFAETDDAVVNCNVLTALDAMHVEVTDAMQAAAITLCRDRPTSRYYDGPAPVLHAAAKVGLPIVDMPELMRIGPSVHWDALQLAMWLRSRTTLDEAAVSRILKDQKTSGLWDYCHWCTGNFTPPISWGSDIVTTAIVLDALRAQATIAGWEMDE